MAYAAAVGGAVPLFFCHPMGMLFRLRQFPYVDEFTGLRFRATG